MRVLLELRPALDGHGGIPQETRLLFGGLSRLPGVQVAGLLQSSNLVLEPGLPAHGPPLPDSQRIDRLSRVVVSLQQGAVSHRLEAWRRRGLRLVGPAAAALGGLAGLEQPLTRFDATLFRDYVWRALFSRTLDAGDFERVTDCEYRVLRWPWSTANAIGVVGGWIGASPYPRLDTRDFDVMIVETPYPGRVRKGTRLVVRYHDAIPLFMPHTIKDRGYHRAMHYRALRRNAADGAWFACVSDSTRQDLLRVLPEAAPRSVVIPNMIAPSFGPDAAADDDAARVREVIWSRRNRHAPHEGGAALADDGPPTPPYLLMVSTIEPRKNHLGLLDAWELLRSTGFPQLQLVLVGALGWEHGPVMERMRPWLERGGLHLLQDVPVRDLALLYRHAQATVCPSFGEGFDFSGVEAMRCGGVVVASDIPVHREVYGDAAEYCSPYAVPAMAQTIARVIDPGVPETRERLRAAGPVVAGRYVAQEVMPAWQAFLERLAAA